MSREAFHLAGKIVIGTATERNRQKLANILQDKAEALKPKRLNLHKKRSHRAALERSEG